MNECMKTIKKPSLESEESVPKITLSDDMVTETTPDIEEDLPDIDSESPFKQKLETIRQQAEEWYNSTHMKIRNWWSKSRGRSSRRSIWQPRNSQAVSVQNTLNRVKLIRYLALAGLFCVVLGVIGFFGLFAWFSRDLPKPGTVVRREGFSTQITDREGKPLYDVYADERRTPVSLDQVSDYMKQATISVEDKDFYSHTGFDPLTPVRIAYNYAFRGGRVVGGSTLTQQLVKNVLLTNERSLPRKFKEFVLAVQIERQFSKDQILEMYLNEVPYGGTAYGVQSASETFFNKDASQLSLVESAILAGLPQSPSRYSPFAGRTDENGDELWKVRARGVLRRMREDGKISKELEEVANTELDSVVFAKQSTSIKAPHFVFYVRDELAEMFGESAIESQGLKVTTTLDLALQDAAQQIVMEEIEKVEPLNITNGSAMVLDPETGEILTMIGSKDYFSDEIDGKYNVAVDGLRQPGSSIKPVTYLAALQKGYTPASMLIDVQTQFAPDDKPTTDPYEPRNYDGQYRGPVSLRNALGSSLNTTAVKLLANVGVERMLGLAYDMGFPTLEPTKENLSRFGLAVTLGGGEVHLIDTVSAYSTFANGGYRVEPVAILKVEDRDGNVLFEHKPVQGKRVIQEGEAFLINHILSDNNARLLAFGPNSLLNTGRPIAVKTGTTNDQKDNWTIGWSQTTMVGVWVGNNDNTAMKQVASGITGASPIWRRIMFEAIDRGRATPEWDIPDSVEQVTVDAISGYPAHDDFPTKTDYALKGTLPSLPDPIHTKLRVCRGQNKLATEIMIARGDFEEKEYIALREDDPISQDGRNRWQEAVNAWVADKEDKYKPPTEYCGNESEQDVYVKLNRPENEKKYNEETIEVEVDAVSVEGIEKVEIWVNGSRRETLTSRPYKTNLNLGKGRFEIYAKARDNKGREAQSSTAKIGTGGEDWKAPTPTPTPEPTSAPTATPPGPAVTIPVLNTTTPTPTP